MQVLISIIILDILKEHPKVFNSKQGEVREESELLGKSENLNDKTTLWLGTGPHKQLYLIRDRCSERDGMR